LQKFLAEINRFYSINMKTLHTYKEIMQQPSCWLKEYEVLVAKKA
jgi:hypothetical protein